MRDDVRQLWTAALRSGDYGQAYGTLCRIDEGARSYCCLGVLCDLALENGVSVTTTHRDDILLYNDEGSILPLEISRWAGISQNPGIGDDESDDPSAYQSLAGLNDGGKSFAEIADLIDEYLTEGDGSKVAEAAANV